MTATALPTTLPPDFSWRQSTVTAYLRCARRVYLEHVLELAPDHSLDGYASISGSAIHATIAEQLRAGLGEPDRAGVGEALSDAFMAELERAQEEGATTNPDTVAAAMERLQNEQLDLVMALLADPRLRAIEWQGLEESWSFEDEHGRHYEGTIDAWGVAREAVRWAESRDGPVWLAPDEIVLVDWKTGTEVELDWVSRALNVQLGLYRAVLQEEGGTVRSFLGVLRDLGRPKRPTDAAGESIPHYLEEINPAWAEAVGIPLEDVEALDACRKKPRTGDGALIPKRLRKENPAWIEAANRPKGPLFHECRIDAALVGRTIADVIDAASVGLWPAGGAATGECSRCPFRSQCTSATGGGA